MKLGAVMPLCVRGSYDVDDLNRAEILFRTLQAFAEPGLIDPFLVVTPADEVELVAEHYAKWKSLNIEVLSEDELVPELTSYPDLRGWRKQQIVKLAAARRIDKDFFITFDADVICLKPLSSEDLVIDGRALLQNEPRSHHPKWWRSSARILGMDHDMGNPEVGMHVTPAILSTALCANLAQELSGSRRGNWVDVLGWLHKPRHPSNWTIERFCRRRWTEYSLYYMCAIKRGELDRYHVTAGSDDAPQLLSVGCKHEFESWNTAESFASDGPSLFCLVGSKSRVEPAAVWQHIKAFVPDSERDMSTQQNRVVLLDRDGVINADLPGSVCSVDDFELLPGAGEAIAEINRKGYRAIVITNQACVGRGDLEAKELDAIHELMLNGVAKAGGKIDGVYICPHVDQDDCDCRKPLPGLIEQAHADYGFDRAATWMIGDSERDIEAALAAGCRAALVRSGKQTQAPLQTGVAVFDNLSAFARDLDDRQERS